jgi:isoleucyl-tRNA synthetase
LRRLVDLGRQARAEARGRRRGQPLGRAMVSAQGWQDCPAELRALVVGRAQRRDARALAATSST